MDSARIDKHVKPVIWLVVPCYNEEDVLPITASLFTDKLTQLVASDSISDQSRVLFVDDGSLDSTWNVISELADENSAVLGLKLSRNCGHQNALLCGLMEARGNCDAAISVDCDGQDSIDAVDCMVENYCAGDEIVYGVRSDRSTDTAFKRGTAHAFYRLMSTFGAEIVYDHADYRLLGSRALDELAEYREVNLFLRGLVPMLGLPSSTVAYKRAERVAGQSHYPLRKMISLAVNGITSLSVKPIRLVSGLGMLFSLLGLVGVIWAFVAFATNHAVDGWASTVVLVSLLGGIQLLSLGVIGEYIGKIYLETKQRPRYVVERRTWMGYPR